MTIVAQTTENRDLKAMVDALFAAAVKRQDHGGEDLDVTLWSELGALGLSRLTTPESAGGSEATWQQAALVLGSAASHAIQIPIAEHDLLAGWLLRSIGDPDGSSDLDTFGLSNDGSTCVMPWGDVARTAVLVHLDDTEWRYTRLELDRGSQPRPVAFGGVTWSALDGLDALNWKPLGDADLGPALMRRGASIRSIQVAGAMDGMLGLTADHARTRIQFGQRLAKFQGVQRLLADLAAEAALASASVGRLVEALDAGTVRDEDVAIVKSCVGHAADIVVPAAHQVHGAIGTTREHRLHRYSGAIYSWARDFGGAATWDRQLSGSIAGDADAGARLWSLVTGV